MTAAELKTYREALGLSAQWLANKVGVSHRSVCYWESGKARVPNDVAELIMALTNNIHRYADEAIKQVNAIALAAGIPEQINLLRYKTDEDLHHYRPDFKGLPVATHAAMLAIIARELGLMGIIVVIVYFDAAAYLAWLGNLEDSEQARATWAAEQ
jgi:transcriptional regulator with XRE-family HTH domain